MYNEVIAEHSQEGHNGPIYVTLFCDAPGEYRVVTGGDAERHVTKHDTVSAAGREYGERVMYMLFRHHNYPAPGVTWIHMNLYN